MGTKEILGKTGTCSKDGTPFGWFASYANTSVGRIVVVMFRQKSPFQCFKQLQRLPWDCQTLKKTGKTER
jgi:beta-lactamase class D